MNNRRGALLTVRGAEGIGKTVTIETALSRTIGVCFVGKNIVPGKASDEIVADCLSSLSKIDSRIFQSLIPPSKRVIFCINYFLDVLQL